MRYTLLAACTFSLGMLGCQKVSTDFQVEMEVDKVTGDPTILARGKMSQPYHPLHTGTFNYRYFNIDSGIALDGGGSLGAATLTISGSIFDGSTPDISFEASGIDFLDTAGAIRNVGNLSPIELISVLDHNGRSAPPRHIDVAASRNGGRVGGREAGDSSRRVMRFTGRRVDTGQET